MLATTPLSQGLGLGISEQLVGWLEAQRANTGGGWNPAFTFTPSKVEKERRVTKGQATVPRSPRPLSGKSLWCSGEAAEDEMGRTCLGNLSGDPAYMTFPCFKGSTWKGSSSNLPKLWEFLKVLASEEV